MELPVQQKRLNWELKHILSSMLQGTSQSLHLARTKTIDLFMDYTTFNPEVARMGGHRKYELLIAMLKISLKFHHTKAPKVLTLLSFGVVSSQKPVRNKDFIDRNGKSLTITLNLLSVYTKWKMG